MKKTSLMLAFTLVAGALVLPASAQEMSHGKACSETVLPPEWSAWGGIPVATEDRIAAGQPQLLALVGMPGEDALFAGEAAFTVTSAGTYRFALESAAWIDVAHGSAKLQPVTFGHGPECSGIRKIVAFDLAPGTYTVRIAKAKAASIRLMVLAD